ncbi:MAG: VWA domain-containing protein [Polyangiaceae bacterium]|nr:VWA domain-containing protein [Polyangiaceae bacterium]
MNIKSFLGLGISSIATAFLTGCMGIGIGADLTADENGVDTDVSAEIEFTTEGVVNLTSINFEEIASSTSGSIRLAGQVDIEETVSLTLDTLPADADVVFVVDTTGSMLWAIEQVKDAVEAAMLSAPERHYGIVVYRDRGDVYIAKTSAELGSDLQSTVDAADKIEAGGGGDLPEHVALGLHTALEMSTFRADKEKHIILIGDAPDHGYTDDPITLDSTLASAVDKGVKIHTVAIACAVVCKKEIELL